MTGIDQNGRPQDSQVQAGAEGDIAALTQAAHLSETLSTMNEPDRFGLAGLLEIIRNENTQMGTLAIGEDLTALGLDLNRPEYACELLG